MLLDSAAQFTLGALLRHLALLLLMVYFSTQYLNAILGISIGTLYVFGDYITRIFNPIQGIIQQMSFVQQAIAAGERVFDLIDKSAEEGKEVEMEVTNGEVTFDHVSFGYNQREESIEEY